MVYDIGYKIKIILADVIAINLAFFTASLVRFTGDFPYHNSYAFSAIFVTVVYLAVLYINRMFDKKMSEFIELMFNIIKTATFACFAIAAIAYFDWTFRLPRTRRPACCAITSTTDSSARTLMTEGS